MRPINIYALTRLTDPERLAKLERQQSGRKRKLKIKKWETEGLKHFSENLCTISERATEFDFYYSFNMPKLGKEFDLLRVNETTVVNIEIKSGNVTDETIRRQLLQNRYYLATLSKSMYFFTYVSEENRIVRLSNNGHLVNTDWTELVDILERQTDCNTGNIEELFSEEKYLISPLTDPGRFLRQEYFLTSQQWDIRKQILKNLKTEPVQGFTGFPGTGKTILLYDIAMQLSHNEKVCIFHLGPHTQELEQLDKRLKRIDYYYIENNNLAPIENNYSTICVDEGHRINTEILDTILNYSKKWNAPIIFSYDREDALSVYERIGNGAELIEAISGFHRYRLTNRIRRSTELASFIRHIMWTGDDEHTRRSEYPSVSLSYAKDITETCQLLHNYKVSGYIFIRDTASYIQEEINKKGQPINSITLSEASCKEYNSVVMVIDDTLHYDERGYLRLAYKNETEEIRNTTDYQVRNLFHGLSRAKEKIAIIVIGNISVFDRMLSILQR